MSAQPLPHALIHGGGAIKDTFDEKDHYYTAQTATRPGPRVNLRQGDHAKLTSEIYDQGDTNTCTANAAAAAFWYMEKGGTDKKMWQVDGPSRLFIYWLARGGYKTADYSISPPPKDNGSSMREAMKGLGKLGACHEAMWPFIIGNAKKPGNVNKKPSPDAFHDASAHKITAYYRLDYLRPYYDTDLSPASKDVSGMMLLKNLKCCLTERFPVAFLFRYYLPGEEMFEISGKNYVLINVWDKLKYPRHKSPRKLPGNVDHGAHCVLAIGYDDARQQVLIQNSWGSTWGENGTFWMPYAWITDEAATLDFWTIRTPKEPKKAFKSFKEVRQEILSAD